MKRFLLFLTLFFSLAPIRAEKLYWVGGNGNFNDPAHWSRQSGGRGGAKIPGLADDVEFDNKSFSGVAATITFTGNNFCHDFIISERNIPVTIIGGINNKLKVQSDFYVSELVSWKAKGLIEFTGEGTISVNTNGNKIESSVLFNSSSGRFTLENALWLSDNSTLYLENGTLVVKGSSVSSGYLKKNSSSVFKLNMENAFLEVKETIVAHPNLKITAVNSDISYFKVKQPALDTTIFGNARINGNNTVQAITSVVVVDSVSCPNLCNGSMLVSFTGPGTGPYTMTFTAGSVTTFNSISSSPFLATGLCGGNYTIRVYNSVGAQIGSSANNIMYEPSPMAVNYNDFSYPLCNGACTGDIHFDVIGGNPRYSLIWNPGNTSFTGLGQGQEDSLKNLCAGSYTVNITDRKGCTATDAFTIIEPSAIAPNAGVRNQLCFGVCDGYAYVAPSGGTPFGAIQTSGILYTVQWDGNAALNNDTLYNLCPGTHTYVITDGNGCTKSGSVTINPQTQLTFTKSTPVPLSCADVCDGTATISSMSGGVPPYSYSWAGPTTPTVNNTATTSTASALCAGTYTCTITDSNGCDTTATFTITAPPILVASVTTTNVSCFNGNNGTATGSHTGGTGPGYTLNWFSATNPPGGAPFSNANPTVTSLTAGTYTLVIVDANGCNDTAVFTITQPSQLQATLTSANPTCFGYTNGQICASSTGGTGTVNFSWLPSGGTIAANCYTTLGSGTYTVTATDQNNCTTTATATLTTPPQIFPNVIRTNPTCNAACNGTATANPSGGSGSGYTYLWSCSAATTASISGQCAGTCTLTVTDGSGCMQNATVTFVDPNPLTVNLNATTLNCAGANTAQIASVVNGGTPPYGYSWNTGAVTPGLSNIGAGTYTLTVTDANGCVKTATVTIASPVPISITTTPVNPTCNGNCNGSISTVLSGGTAPYTVLWLPTNSTNQNQLNLCAGVYTITVTDFKNCTQTQTVTLTDPLPVTVTTNTTLTSCIGTCNGTATATGSGGNAGGYTYTWNNGQTTQTATGLCSGTYTVVVRDPAGCTGSATASVSSPAAVTVNISSITPSCTNICNGTATINAGGGTPGYTYTVDAVSVGSTVALTNLCTGTHTVVATDFNGCTATTTFTVPVQVSITVTASSTTLTCAGDCNATATANVAGGSIPITYLWTPTNQNTQTATGLCAGTHTILITDNIGCQVSTTVTFVDPTPLTTAVVTTPVDCNGNCSGTAQIIPGGGTPPYTVTWSNGTTGNTASSLCVGSYTATISDANGCTTTQVVNITEPTAFTVTNTANSPTVCSGTDGSITVTPSGGSGSYSYSWAPVAGNTATLSGIGAGVYTLTLVDLITGCDTIIPFALSDPNGPGTSQSSSAVLCPGACTGSGTVDVVSGTAPFTVTWPNGASGTAPMTQNNLCAGVYAVQITDATACISYETIIITQPSPFVDNDVLTNVSCNGGADGSIVLAPTGGTAPFTYTIDGNPDDNSMTGQGAGTHTVVITDANGCSYTQNYVLTQPAVLSVNQTHTNVNCVTGFGSATAVASGGTLPYTYLWSNGANTATAANLVAGTYTCVATDANGCTAQIVATITSNPVLVSGFTSANNLCSTGSTGAASFNASGGSGVYTYSWSTGQTTSSVSGLSPGTYTATVYDNNGCSVTQTFTITTPAPVVVSLTSSNPTCNGSGTGAIAASPSGGTPGYTYSWSPNVSVSQNAVNLTAGSYTVTVRDANNCSATSIAVLTDNPVLLANVSPTQPTCYGDCNGMLTATPVGGIAPYTYSWGPSPTGSSNTLTGLCVGSYSVVVTDAATCRDTVNIILTQPPQVGLTASSGAATCNTIPCNGSITVNSITGNTLNWLNSVPPGYTGLAQTNLCAGVYYIEVSDINGCKDTVSIGVGNSDGPIINIDTTDVTCVGSCNGTATVVSVSGNGPFTYSWSAPITDTDSIASGLCVGTYQSLVTDINGCVGIADAIIHEPLPMDDHEVITNASCNGVSNGSIVLAPVGGTPPYSYAWSNGSPDSPSNTNLAPGSYSVTITDANLCTYQYTYTVGANSQILYQLTVSNNTCFGQCNGVANLNNVNGGTSPYSFVWSDGQAGTTANALCAGSYSVVITDNVGCTRTVTATITQPSQIIANPTVTNTACGLCTGSAQAVPTGGSGTYSYSWSNGQTTASASGLCAGVYMLDLTDGAGCAAQFSVTINSIGGPAVNVVTTDAACAGQCTGTATATGSAGTAPYQYNWLSGGQTTSSVTGLCPGTYTVQVRDADNCLTNQTVVINETNTISISSVITPANCGVCDGAVTLTPAGGAGGYTFAWSNGLPSLITQTGLCAGSYSVVVTDAVGCSSSAFVNVNSKNGPVITVVTDSVLCNGDNNGSATVSITGGLSPYAVAWSTGAVSNPTLSGLPQGSYAVTVEDAAGCITSQVFTIEQPEMLALSLNNYQLPTCAAACNGSLTAIPSGGTLPYSYTWNPGGQNTNVISNLCAGNYSVQVTDANGCQVNQASQLVNNPVPFTVVPSNTNATCGQCDGASTLAVSGGTAPYAYVWSNGNTGPSSTGLCAGVYMVDIIDNLGCTQQYSMAVNNSSGPAVTVLVTDVTCAGTQTGAAAATVTGGTAPFQYNWLSGGQTTSSIFGLSAGTYFVQVKDANNCITTQQVDINEQTVINANVTTSAATCGVCDGTASLNPSGGSGSYSYVWSNGLPAVATQTGLCAGTYSVEITDLINGCKDTVLIAINSNNAPVITLNTDSAKCYGAADGQVTLSVTGGVTPYTVNWSNGSTSFPVLNGLGAGSYAVSVEDAAGCIAAQAFLIEEPSQLGLSISNSQLPNCAAACNGSLTAIPSGGSLPYTYLWSNGVTSSTNANLCAGTYSITVTDNNGCASSQTTLLNPDPTPFTVNQNVTQPGCNLCDGLIDLTVSGGTLPYTYIWNTGDLTEDISNVCAAVYQVDITDNTGCTQTVSIPVSNSNGITGETINVTNESCFNSCDGSASVTPVGGTPGYTYLWLFNGATSNSQSNLCANTYYVQISDTNGCIRTTTIVIDSPSELQAVPAVVSPTCGNSDGSITINVSGGTGAFSYSWLPAVAGNVSTASGLPAGVYTIAVSDAASCSQSFTVNLSNSNGPVVTTTSTDVSCYGVCDGSITLGISGSNPTTVLWNNGSTANPLTNLCPGNYTAVITDNIAGCVTTIQSVIAEPDTLTFSVPNVIDPLCNGACNGSVTAVPSGGTLPYNYVWVPAGSTGPAFSNACAGTYTLTVTDAKGCVITNVSTLTDPSDIVVSGIVSNASCSSVPSGAIDITVSGGVPGYSYQWSGGGSATSEDISGVFIGSYTVVVTDSKLCTDTTSYLIAATDTVVANAGNDLTFCINGNVVLDGSLSSVNNGIITYSWSQIPSAGILGTNNSVTVTPSSGTNQYQLVVTNSLGCNDTDTVVLVANPLPLANAGPDVEVVYGQSSGIGGSPTAPSGATVSWVPTIGLSGNTVLNPVANNTVTTTYTVIVTDTATGCVSRDSMLFTVLPQIVFPNGISPNGDGKNDLWVIDAIYKFPNNEVEVYNRWGDLLYYKKGYDNTWGGTYNGKPLPIGTYYYVIKLNDPAYPDVYTGPITIFK